MKKILFVLTIILSIVVTPSLAIAADNNIGFDIQAQIPANQTNADNSFFDLRMTPEQTQTINVIINNTSSEDSNFTININQAYTNSSGFIDYADSKVAVDSSQKYKISDMVSYEPKITVNANSSIMYPIEITMPAESYDGQILAGIQVIKNVSKEEGISNKYGYILGLKLTETDNVVKRELNLLSVKPAASFARTSVVAQLQNPTMDAYGHLKYAAKVTSKETNKVIREVNYDNDMQIAPNSSYDFAIDWDNQALEAGEYSLNLVVTDAKSNEWKFNEDFTITAKEAKEINKVTINKGQTKLPPIWLMIVLGIILLVIIMLVIIFIKKRNKKEQN